MTETNYENSKRVKELSDQLAKMKRDRDFYFDLYRVWRERAENADWKGEK